MIELILLIIATIIAIILGLFILRVILIGIGLVLTFAAPILIMIGTFTLLTSTGVI